MNWPEGIRVRIEPVPAEEKFGVSEEEWSDSPEAIEAWIAWYDSLEPPWLTPEEEAEWKAWRQKVGGIDARRLLAVRPKGR